jgi:carboxymethylenebutenolidase
VGSALLAETVNIRGYAGDEIAAYYARPLGPGPYPGVVVLHHAPGWDEWNKSVARRLAFHGYAAILPNLHHRAGQGSAEDLAAAVRASGGVPDTQCIGDVDGAVDFLRAAPYASGKVGVMGFCSGGRQTYLVACNNPTFDAAVDCWGGRVVATPEQLTPNQPVAPLDMTPDLACPMLALFGEDDPSPSPADAARTEEELKKYNKVYEFHMYKGAGHGFFAVDRPNYRQHAAVDGWEQVFKWYDRYLR